MNALSKIKISLNAEIKHIRETIQASATSFAFHYTASKFQKMLSVCSKK